MDADKLSKLMKIKLFLFDVDGVLSNGMIIYDNNGNEMKIFNAKDGCGLTLLKKFGYKYGIITQRYSEMVNKRFTELKADYIYQNIKNKKEIFELIIKENNLNYDEVLYMGDDLPDLKILKMVGFSVTPNDGNILIKENVDYICKNNGGNGAVREIIDIFLMSKFSREEIFSFYD